MPFVNETAKIDGADQRTRWRTDGADKWFLPTWLHAQGPGPWLDVTRGAT